MLYLQSLFLFLFFSLYLSAQEQYVFQHLTIEDGLLSNPKVSTYQDSQGFYWFCSASGIQRFDGSSFVNYRYNYGDKTISRDWITKPVEDKEKNIWIINEQGINIYRRKERMLSRLYMSDALDSNRSNVTGIVKDRQNKIWIVTSKNIYYYSYDLHKPILYSSIIRDSSTGMYSPQYDPERNGLWLVLIGPTTQIVYFDISKKQITYPFKKSVDQVLGHPDLISFFRLDRSNNLWFANYVGDLCRYNINTASLTHYSILHERAKEKPGSPNSTITDGLDDGNGTIWFSGDYHLGLLKYDKKTDKFSSIQLENGSEYGLHYSEVTYDLFKDRDGNIWINGDLGMNIFNPEQQQFKYLQNSSSFKSPFSADVSSIFQSRSGDIWISTWGDGVFKYNSHFVLQKHYVHNNKDKASLGEPLNRTWCFSEDGNGRIWIGCQHGMLSALDTTTGRFTNRIIPEFNNSTIMHMIKDRNNNIWFGLYNGLIAKFDSASKKITAFTNAYQNTSHEVSSVDALFADERNNIFWSPGNNGIKEFNDEKKVVINTMLYPRHINFLSAFNDSIIMGGTAKGFFLLNQLTGSVKFFSGLNGLSNSIYGAVSFKKNEAWIIASDGVEKLNLSNGKIINFNLADGIRDHVFNGPFCQLKNGTIMVSARSGIIYFDPDGIKAKPPPHDVVITGFAAAQRNLSVDSLLQNKTVNLSYHQNVITIDYASVSFTGRKTDQYFYRLEGIDKDWIAAGTRRSVTYANIAPGHYVFKVKSQNEDGIETPHITILGITVYPPWWRTWWAYLLWFVIAASIVYVVYDYRKRSSRAISQVRQKIATDLHDDIGSTLNSISVYSEVAARQLQTNDQNAQTLLQKMGTASRNMIDTMNDIVWAVNPKNDQFENILQRMQYFAGELLSAKNILLLLNTDEKIKNIKLPMEKRKNFYLIFKEAINNAYKYSNAKTVNVIIAHQANDLVMIISDDGNGFETAKKSPGGNGLRNMQTRAKEMGGQLNLRSWPMKGTRIELHLPLK